MSFAVDPIGRYRVNAFRQRGSVALALRTVNTVVPSPEQLGLPQAFVDLYTRKRGLILVTGPTGSGKSTSLASVINMVNEHRDAHIITLEDPIEYLHLHKTSMVNQREIGFDSMTYANALRAALREDPDVILVGEMRDFETISVAITAAETGHLVLSTLHTIGAASTVDRIIDVFPPHQQQQIRVQLANVLEAVISQQLIPTADGNGRAAAFEVMIANSAVRALIREGKSHQLLSVMQTNRKLGMIAMDEALTALFQEGKITRDMAIQYAVDPDGMQQKLR
jgi:twitching motility protein PilT